MGEVGLLQVISFGGQSYFTAQTQVLGREDAAVANWWSFIFCFRRRCSSGPQLHPGCPRLRSSRWREVECRSRWRRLCLRLCFEPGRDRGGIGCGGSAFGTPRRPRALVGVIVLEESSPSSSWGGMKVAGGPKSKAMASYVVAARWTCHGGVAYRRSCWTRPPSTSLRTAR